MPLQHIRDIRSENRKLNTEEYTKQSVILKSRPVRAWVSFSERCNLNCVHCPRVSYGDAIPNNAEMPLKIFEKLEEEIFPFLDECKIGGNSLGEQLLAKHWDFYSERIGKHPFNSQLVTNGLLLNRKKITKEIWSLKMQIMLKQCKTRITSTKLNLHSRKMSIKQHSNRSRSS